MEGWGLAVSLECMDCGWKLWTGWDHAIVIVTAVESVQFEDRGRETAAVVVVISIGKFIAGALIEPKLLHLGTPLLYSTRGRPTVVSCVYLHLWTMEGLQVRHAGCCSRVSEAHEKTTKCARSEQMPLPTCKLVCTATG